MTRLILVFEIYARAENIPDRTYRAGSAYLVPHAGLISPSRYPQARNLLTDLEDAGTRVKFAPHDRDASFTAAFDAVFRAAGIRVIRYTVQASRMNSVMERWIGSCRRELLDRNAGQRTAHQWPRGPRARSGGTPGQCRDRDGGPGG